MKMIILKKIILGCLGFKYALSNSTQKRNFKKKLINKKKLNVLIHGGGTDQYINIKQTYIKYFSFIIAIILLFFARLNGMIIQSFTYN